MFTGALSFEAFRREHPVQYQRLVDALPRPMTKGSKILGWTLIATSLTLLVLLLVGCAGQCDWLAGVFY